LMSISWYPGHMHKARKELAAAMKDSQLLIEVLDARIPHASSNPLFTALRANRPCLRILNKADLADPDVTASWQRYFRLQPASDCLINGLDQGLKTTEIIRIANRLTAAAGLVKSPRQALIAGIPNVGKSTLLNQIAERKLAKTGNEPAMTRQQQRIRLADDWYLIDTPGLLWPRLEDQTGAYRLAMTGSIRNTAIDAEDIAWFAAETLLKDAYPALAQRYTLPNRPDGPRHLLEMIGRQRGCLGKHGAVDLHKAAELLLNDYRSGKIGRLSLESPPVVAK
ncbi:MAG: ribosome biogenesis GTPase YlqF, partial [Pseudohongiellaceae bacterium]